MATSDSLRFHMRRARAEAEAQGSSFRAPTEESSWVMYWMSEALETYATHPELIPRVELPADIQEIGDFNFKNRLNAAIAKSCDLLNEAQAQLEAPFPAFLPTELTHVELETEICDESWDFLHAKATEFNNVELALNEELFDEVNKLLDDLDAGGTAAFSNVKVSSYATTPTMEGMGLPSDNAKWIAESKEAGEKARAKRNQRKLLANARAKAEELSGMIAMRLR